MHAPPRSSTWRRLLAGIALALSAGACCGDDEPGSDGDSRSAASSQASGGSSTSSTSTTSTTSSSRSGGGGAPGGVTSAVGAGAGGAGGGDCVEPDPEACAEAGSPGGCVQLGCSSEFFDELVFDAGDDACLSTFDVPGCLPVTRCETCELPSTTLYFRDQRVIEWDRGCLEGWSPCVGATGEPPACDCGP